MKHKNFTESSEIDTMWGVGHPENTPLVAIAEINGTNFFHMMTTTQARELAADLVKKADEVEAEAKGMDKGMAKPVPPPPPPPPPGRIIKHPF